MRARHWLGLLLATCLLAGGLTGCTDAITVWPVARGVRTDVDVPPLAGFYLQYLVRVDSDRIEVCTGLPVWVILLELQQQGPVGFSLDSLQYTVRDQEVGDLMVFISRPQPLREFLEVALPEAVALCDRAAEDFKWIAFERYEPDEPPAAPD